MILTKNPELKGSYRPYMSLCVETDVHLLKLPTDFESSSIGEI